MIRPNIKESNLPEPTSLFGQTGASRVNHKNSLVLFDYGVMGMAENDYVDLCIEDSFEGFPKIVVWGKVFGKRTIFGDLLDHPWYLEVMGDTNRVSLKLDDAALIDDSGVFLEVLLSPHFHGVYWSDGFEPIETRRDVNIPGMDYRIYSFESCGDFGRR